VPQRNRVVHIRGELDHGPCPHPEPIADAFTVADPDASAVNSSEEADRVISLLVILALLACMWAEANGNRTARPLIASAALTCVLSLLGVPFDFGLWLSIDVAVIYAIERTGRMGESEQAIFALFPPAWVLYHLQPAGWRDAVAVIVALQFLLTVPWDRFGERVWKARVGI
jgi:hypothetical protein